METRSLNFIVDATGGVLAKGEPQAVVKRVCNDSRQAGAGDLFFALAGEKTDGHDYVNEVGARGAVAVVVAKSWARSHPDSALPNCAVLVVEDPRAAMGKVAAAHRNDFNIPIIAVAGSNGKTTTKELIASVLRQKYSVLWSEASFNNDIGVPLTLLRLEKSHQAAVLEAGTNHPGELAPLLKMIRPRFGVMTTIGREHLEYFGDLDGVAREEGALAEELPSDGKLFMGGDHERVSGIAHRSRAPVVRVGIADSNDWRARNIRVEKGGTSFRVEAPISEFSGTYRIPLIGRHQAVNALFALAVGAELGLSRAQIEQGLAECPAPKMRMQLNEINGVRILDDSYNANADSTLAALQALQDLPCKGRRIAVLGDMAELGTSTEAAHAEVGRRAAELGVGQLFAVGKMAPITARAARAAGLTRVFEFSDAESAASAVKTFLKSGDLVLVKASRSSRLERIVEVVKRET